MVRVFRALQLDVERHARRVHEARRRGAEHAAGLARRRREVRPSLQARSPGDKQMH